MIVLYPILQGGAVVLMIVSLLLKGRHETIGFSISIMSVIAAIAAFVVAAIVFITIMQGGTYG